MKRRMMIALLIMQSIVVFGSGAQQAEHGVDDYPDQENERVYRELIAGWKSVEDINEWIGENFAYDMDKALLVSRLDASGSRSDQILSPEEFVLKKRGICVDLARFGCESLLRISPELNPRYLMIEFEPVQKDGSILRLHWLVQFQRDGGFYTFADSNRPGVIDGPYASVESMVTAYEEFRGRKVVTFKVLESYRKKHKAKRMNQEK